MKFTFSKDEKSCDDLEFHTDDNLDSCNVSIQQKIYRNSSNRYLVLKFDKNMKRNLGTCQ